MHVPLGQGDGAAGLHRISTLRPPEGTHVAPHVASVKVPPPEYEAQQTAPAQSSESSQRRGEFGQAAVLAMHTPLPTPTSKQQNWVAGLQ